MPKSLLTFKQKLLPQEERLEILKQKSDLFIGIPKEISNLETRVSLTPDAVSTLVCNGHRVMIESGAGKHAGFNDSDYSDAGAEITRDTAKVFACPFILKVAPPNLEQIKLIKPRTIVISALQLKTRSKSYFEALSAKRITALAFEFIKDRMGTYSMVRILSEIAGAASVLIASELLSDKRNGSGQVLGNISGVPPVEITILGAGTVGQYAAKSALGLGANVKVFDPSIEKLYRIKETVNASLYTSTLQTKHLSQALNQSHVVIAALRGSSRCPIVISEDMVRNMRNRAVLIDVSIDMGGCFETSEVTTHNQPTFEKHGVIHYGVPNIPARYPKTSSIAISNIMTPYLLKIAEDGGIENSLRFDSGLKNGLYFYHGILTSQSVGQWFDLKYSDPNLLIF